MIVGGAWFVAHLAALFSVPVALDAAARARPATMAKAIPLARAAVADERKAADAAYLVFVAALPSGTSAPRTHTRAGGTTLTLPQLIPPTIARRAFDRVEVDRARARAKGQMIAPFVRFKF